MKKFILFYAFITIFYSMNSIAAKPACYLSHGGYCKYNGKVKRIYINSSGLILLYFDASADPSEMSAVIPGVGYGGAAAFKVEDNPEFAKLFYSTALAAQATNRSVIIQMRGRIGSYAKFDRIWLYE